MRGLGALAILNAIGCSAANHAGHLAAHPNPHRGPRAARRPTLELAAACGETRADAPTIHRAPYLQRLGAHGTRILWTTESSAPAEVVVTTPEGTPVGRFAAAVDRAARLAGARQLVASVGGLAPDTPYCYEVQEGGHPVVGRTAFRTAPAAGSGAPVRFVAFGDSGSGGADQQALLRQIPTVAFDLLLHTGDVAYPSGDRRSLEATFFSVYERLLRHHVGYPVAGNHEYKTDRAAPFREVFDLPGNESWYSFDWGDVHFVAVDTERLGSEQAAWLERDLTAARGRWTIVYLHKPPISAGEHGGDAQVRRWIHPIVARHRVKLVLAGHEHDYERTRPIDGVTYVITGGGGNGTRPVRRASWTAYSDDVIHFVYVTIQDDVLRLHAIDATGAEFDAVELRRGDAVARTGPSRLQVR